MMMIICYIKGEHYKSWHKKISGSVNLRIAEESLKTNIFKEKTAIHYELKQHRIRRI